jgi:hypothetical protein
LGEFDVQYEPGISEKIYTYIRTPDDDIVAHHYTFFPAADGSMLLIKTTYFNELIDGEFHYKIEHGRKVLIEEYYYEYPGETANEFEKVKGDILVFRDVDEGRKYKSLEVKVSYTNSIGFKKTFEERDGYESDTVYRWNDEILPTLKFKYSGRTNTVIRYFPFFGSLEEYGGESYYAKGIGLVMSKRNSDGGELALKSIEEIEEDILR